MITYFYTANLLIEIKFRCREHNSQYRCQRPEFAAVGLMKNLAKNTRAQFAAMLAAILCSCAANAADAQREPMAVVHSLGNRIYAIGETTGDVSETIDAEKKAADEIRRYIEGGSTEGLLANEKDRQSPLATAAYRGYPNVVAALLTSSLVMAHINDADELGVTPWIAASFSMKQSGWVCNPAMLDDPYRFVPMLVTQDYYVSNSAPPYRKTRDVLEASGASADLAKGKQVWLINCKTKSEEARAKVQASTDLQRTIQELGATDLNTHLIKLQGKP